MCEVNATVEKVTTRVNNIEVSSEADTLNRSSKRSKETNNTEDHPSTRSKKRVPARLTNNLKLLRSI